MTITFRIQYHTTWGESLRVLIQEGPEVELSTTDGNQWQGQTHFMPANPSTPVSYRYAVYRDGHPVRIEFGTMPHTLCPTADEERHYLLQDAWRDLPAASYRFSSAFCPTTDDGVAGEMLSQPAGDTCIVFRVLCPSGGAKRRILALSGNCRALGEWGKHAPLRMYEVRPNIWQLAVDASVLPPSFQYKYVTLAEDGQNISEWESSDNRFLAPPALQPGETYVGVEEEAFFASEQYKVAGSAIPVFSLRSEGSYGVGDFGDLKAFIRWAADTHQRAVQVLPINDTTMTHTWTDSYPYSSISIYAFHPMYVDLRQLPPLHDPDATIAFEQKRKALNNLPQVDYEEVNHWKRAYLKAIFQQEQAAVLASESYQTFYRENAEWLRPYAAFCYLRDRFHTPDFQQWGEYATYRPEMAIQLCAPESEAYTETAYHCFVQYHLHLQLSEARDYARRKGVVFKGDLPIGVSRTSADAWVNRSLFNMDSQAGAPPDAFSADGQNWGLPTYNWEEMSKDGYAWWRARLKKMSEYFDVFRIDHLLGFFRIWEIPVGEKSGLMGHFNPALPYSTEELSAMGFDMRISGAGSSGNMDVLFIEDPHRKGWWHPRIAAHSTTAYAALDDTMKQTFNRLYDDFFYHRHNAFWKESAMRKLSALLSATGMLACGEDLGMIPACVSEVMDEYMILSLEIQRMSKNPDREFADPADYPYYSVCTTSTHDMNPLRAWWEEDRKVTGNYWHDVMHRDGEAPRSCEPWICREIIRKHLESSSMLTILPLQDWLSIDGELRFPDPSRERINIPVFPRYYWRYRMHLTIENLISQDKFNSELRKMIEDSGRSA